MARLRTARRLIRPLVAAVTIIVAATVAGARADEPGDPGEAEFAALVRAAVEFHVRPAHERFAQRAELLELDLEALCAAPDQPKLEEARRALAGAIHAISALETVRVGPLAEDNRRERIAFWPDARGRGLAQVQRILADEDPSALDPTSLSGKSVAVQGLPALEFLLYGAGSEAMLGPGSFRCGYALAIAANLRAIGDGMVRDWEAEDGAAALLLEPGPENPLFLDHAEAAGEMVAGMATAMEIVADQKLRAILGDSPALAKPRQAPWWRSGETLPALEASFEATQHLFEVSGAADLLSPGEAWLGNAILFEARNAIRVARAIRQPIAALVVDPAGRDAAKYLAVVAASLKRSIGREYPAMVGLAQGFNALDGD